MAELPAGVTAVLDDAFDDGIASEASSVTSGSVPRDAHQERFGKYVPPHMRGHHQEIDDKFVNFRDRDPARGPDPDRTEGADNDKYQRLVLNVNFAIGFELIKKVLRPQFPGVFFHCSGNTNHDHPISHVVTQIGTRFLQRKIHPGAVVLDVFGNPNASERFNKSQAQAMNPKRMTALVDNKGDSDFIREVNKWGPVLDDVGSARYLKKSLEQAVRDGDCDGFDTFQFVHTLYYTDFSLVKKLLQTKSATGKAKRVLALVHRHMGERGSINNGEQTFEVKQHRMFEGGLLKQVNVKTNSAYVHPNLTPILFKEKKVWYPSDTSPLEMRDRGSEKHDGVGITWECHMVNEDTWIIEMVLCDNRDRGDWTFEDLWDDDKMFQDEDPLGSDPGTSTSSDRTWENRMEWLPAIGKDRDFVHLDLVSKPLFDKLRLSAMGRARGDKKVFADLIKEAKHLTSPSALFGDKDGMRCPPEKVVDHVMAAILVDYEREGKLLDGMIELKPLLRQHAEGLRMGSNLRGLSFNNLVQVLRQGLSIARDVNHVVRHKDPVDAGIGALDGWLAAPA